MQKTHIQPGDKVKLKLTQTERKLILNDLLCLDEEYEQIIRGTPAGEPVMMTLDELDDFCGYIAAEANHTDDKELGKKLDRIFAKIQDLLGKYSDEESPSTIKIEDARKTKEICDQATQIAEWSAQVLVATEQLGVKNEPLEHFRLAPGQRDVLLLAPGIKKTIKNKLTKENPSFTVAEVASMTMSLAEHLLDVDANAQVPVLLVVKHLMDCLQEGIVDAATAKTSRKAKGKKKPVTDVLYQFKITLWGSEPVIWRRIQVQDCTLDELHEHIQTAMGWTNSHLHQFEINGERYGDPELLDDGFEDFDCVGSTRTMLSDVLPKRGKRFVFTYEYDFGDGWEHEVLLEGRPPVEKGKKYPVCLEGERACPPEDVGGVWGYQEFLAAIADPEHEEHETFLEWCGGSFSPAEFDPVGATRRMVKGLPDWRAMQ
jgi:hypothetical protein